MYLLRYVSFLSVVACIVLFFVYISRDDSVEKVDYDYACRSCSFNLIPMLSPCPAKCICIGKAVRCMNLYLDKVPRVPQEMTTLDLRTNNIKEIAPGTFDSMKNLEILLMNYNQLTSLNDGVFNGLENLEYLSIYNNKIKNIDENVFYGLEKLKQLYLHSNQIEEFGVDTFSDLPSLERLFLHGNRIKVLPDGSFKNLPSLRRIRLDGNPIICDCNVMGFVKMINESKQVIEPLQAAATCHSPDKMIGKPVASMNKHDLHCEEPQIVSEPIELEVQNDHPLYLMCKASGKPIPEILWLKDSKELSVLDERYEITEEGTLKINYPNSSDAGSYECVARNSLGEARSHQAQITFDPELIAQELGHPRFIAVPSNFVVKKGTDFVTFNCIAIGIPKPHLTWYKNDNKLVLAKNMEILSDGLKISNLTEIDEGVYTCEAKNVYGKILFSAYAKISTPPVVHVSQSPDNANAGDTIYVKCNAYGRPHPSSIMWFKNDAPIVPTRRIYLLDTTLIINSAKESDAGTYVCRADNGIERVDNPWNIKIHTPKKISPIFVLKPDDADVFEGSRVELLCKVRGFPRPRVSWKKDGSNLVLTSNHKVTHRGNLHIFNASLSDDGRYECSAVNIHGRVTASAFLSVKRKPEILSKPGDKFVDIAFSEATKEVDLAIKKTMDSLFENNGSIPNIGDLYRLIRFPNAPTRELARANEVFERTLVNIRKHLNEGKVVNVSSEFDYEEYLSPEQIQLIAKLSGCISHRAYPNCSKTCFHWRYRSLDGTCNNLENPTWGSSNTGFQRLLFPIYENGINTPIGWSKNVAYNGFSLPNAREISTKLISTHNITEDKEITHMVMQWGQFLDHDLDHATPSVSSQSWDGIDCKRSCEYAAPCFPIDVPHNDSRVKNRKCMDFTRSSAVCGSGMTSVLFGAVQHREQINQLTSFLDASQVYGFSEDVSQELRELSPNNGLLRTGPTFPSRKPLLPFSSGKHTMDCRKGALEDNIKCFTAGDIRANEQVGLLAMHTIWMREHNRIARELKTINPKWSGDTIFHEARKIVGAEMQHITYQYWLPIIIGPSGMEKLGNYKIYDPNINPTISNVFATAALRFGHSLINPILKRLDSTYKEIPEGHLPLHKAFFSSWRVVDEGGVDPLLRGLLDSPAKLKTPTQNLNADLTEKLFHVAHAVALDLAAMNIQRSRDHAIPFYTQWRKFCGMSEVYDFSDLSNEISSKDIRKKLKELYGTVNNIDVWVGGILEDQLPKAKVGPLFQCLLVEQFVRLRDGDRFWYENMNVFKPQQLTEIKKVSLSSVLCDNGDNINWITNNTFILPNIQGEYIPCSQVDRMNLKMWKDCENCSTESCKTETQDFDPPKIVEPPYQNDDPVCSPELIHNTNVYVKNLEDAVHDLSKKLKRLQKIVHQNP